MDKPPFRILALDGGGIRGLFSAAFLAELERLTGRSLAEHFDLIAGTSTGSIIALGLAAGIGAEKILDFYKDHGDSVFPTPPLLNTTLASTRK